MSFSSTKYRKPVLKSSASGEDRYIEKRNHVRDLTREICRSLDIEIVKGHVRPDHVHSLLDVPPRLAPSRVMQAIKGKTSHHLLQDHRKFAQGVLGDDIFGHEGTSWRRLGM